MSIISYRGKSPEISKECFVAESATLVGDVVLGEASSVWFGASIRADKGPIRIGRHVNVQDNCVLHMDAGGGCYVGDYVSIGHSAIVHGATVDENSLIGMGAILLNNSRIGRNSIVGAGALVTSGVEIPEGSLVLGSPASVKRKLTPLEIKGIGENAGRYDELRKEYLAMGKKE